MKHFGKSFILILAVILLLGSWACNKVEEDVPFSQELLAALNQSTLPLTGPDPTLPDDELAPLADLGQALIVGLGEETHGTHEFFAMKHRLFRYLVERFDFRAFAFECDFGESIYFDRWLNGGAGDLDDMMRHTMHFWTWRTPEVKALLQWMRQVNLARPEAERLHYIGVDCQFATYQPGLLREYLQHVSPLYLEEIEPLLVREESYRDAEFKNLTAEQHNALQRELEAEYLAWEGLKNEFTRQSSPQEFEVARQLIRSLIQANEVRFAVSILESAAIRDLHMASNTTWTQQNFSGGQGIALWAHNAHVANDFPKSMGFELFKSFGERYKIVGFTFCQGSFTAVSKNGGPQTCVISEPPLSGSVNDLFFAADKKMFILRLDNLAQGAPLQTWFSQEHKMLSIGSKYDGPPEDYYDTPKPIILQYDILIHFNQTTFAPQL